MVLISMLSIFCVVGTKSTMRKIVPPLGGTSPTLVLARSAVQEKSGGLLSVTHISLAGFGERKVVNWTWPSNMATALPEESILVTTRRTSGGCCAATEPAKINATPGITHDSLLVIGFLPKRSASGRPYAGFAPARVLSSTVMAEATTLATSERLVGTIMVLLVLARLPRAPMYSSAILRFAACSPPSLPIASATTFTAAAVASATTRSAV